MVGIIRKMPIDGGVWESAQWLAYKWYHQQSSCFLKSAAGHQRQHEVSLSSVIAAEVISCSTPNFFYSSALSGPSWSTLQWITRSDDKWLIAWFICSMSYILRVLLSALFGHNAQCTTAHKSTCHVTYSENKVITTLNDPSYCVRFPIAHLGIWFGQSVTTDHGTTSQKANVPSAAIYWQFSPAFTEIWKVHFSIAGLGVKRDTWGRW